MDPFLSASSGKKAKLWLSLSFLPRVASSFLKSDKDRIGSSYKKTIYKEYRDGSYMDEIAQPAWLGFLGPVLKAEVGDVILIHLKNFATRPYTIHPHGVFYEKDSEGKSAPPHFFSYLHQIFLFFSCPLRERIWEWRQFFLPYLSEVGRTLQRNHYYRFCYPHSVWLWASHCPSLDLRFFIKNVEI